MSKLEEYPYINQFSRSVQIPADNLRKAFLIEKEFHTRILEEQNADLRKKLYREMYTLVHPLYNKSLAADTGASAKPIFHRVVKLFEQEFKGKSILDVGCGTGAFLECVSKKLPHKRLVGVDTSSSVLPQSIPGVEFKQADVIDFELGEKFDVVFSHHLFEHIAPADVSAHLSSVKKAMAERGRYILVMPNRLFGPSDVTRIVDYTYTNETPAMGSHVNELSFSETLNLLEQHGFKDFQTVLPIPRIKYYFPKVRFNPKIITYIENSPMLLGLIHRVRFRSPCLLRMDVVLICS